MEDLTKTQLILLALMVSFITSIATGIVTVSLLEQAPPSITQTVNRVVERTVERVVPGQTASVITRETTVVVKEENLIIEAVEKNSKSVVRVILPDEKGESRKILGVGVFVKKDGTIVTDSLNLGEAKKFLVKTFNDVTFSVSLSYADPLTGLSFLKAISPEAEEQSLPKFSNPNLGDSSNIKLGQSVIAIGGLADNSVSTGIVSKLNKEKVPTNTDDTNNTKEDETSVSEEVVVETESVEVEFLRSISSSILMSHDYSGGPLIDVDGFIMGINLKRKEGDISVPINLIIDILTKNVDNKEVVE